MEILGRPFEEPAVEARLDALVARHARAGSGAMDVLNLIGAQAEGLLDRLPAEARARLGTVTERALLGAAEAAHGTRDSVPDMSQGRTRLLTTVMGAAGGMGGLPTALAELPVTVTVLLRAIQDEAAAHGFDPAEPGVRFASVEVFGTAGPLSDDDGSDLGFIGARVTLTGAALRALIARVAPRLAAVLGQKLAAQSVPLLGAAAGAATNYAYTRYYQDMAHVHFGLRRLAIEADRDPREIVAAFRERAGRVTRG
ncbi:protein EcsC [Roseovarius sp. A46]|uniref:EcsC family protein n=1 Tax=Roseovarius sp. A46 TaxID=2109331 RepID=UPI0010131EB2|nr:EcsC family protein [Roseovarius sp. A46]RXV58500.1 protein EcsC [Roseovarius sp. A46]